MKVMSTEIAFNIPFESYYRIYNLFKTLFFDLLEFSVKKNGCCGLILKTQTHYMAL